MGLSGINPTNLIPEGLQEAPGEASTAATFLFVAVSSDNGQAFGHAAHGVLHLIEGSPAALAVSSDNGQAFGHAAHGVLHLVEGSPASALAFLSLLSFLSLLLFPPLR